MMTKTILAIGEVLWDVFPDGAKFGGALANYACACAELGGPAVRVSLVSAVGDDDLGRRARLRLVEHGVNVEHLATTNDPTGQVNVSLDEQGRASYVFIENPAWDHVPTTPELLTAARTADAICFGTLGQRAAESRLTVQEVLRNAAPDCLRILDLNLRPPHWTREVILTSLPMANVLKLNDEELPILAEMLGYTGTPDEQLRRIRERFSFRVVALTCGERGAVLMSEHERIETPTEEVEMIDTVGAGDSFTAALTLGLLHQQPLVQISRWANSVAAYVCTQAGGTPTFPAKYRLRV